MSRYDDRHGSTVLYVSHLASRTRACDLERIFEKHGRIRNVDMHRDFAYVEFRHHKDADDARHHLDGRGVDGSRIVVKFENEAPKGGTPGDNRSLHEKDTRYKKKRYSSDISSYSDASESDSDVDTKLTRKRKKKRKEESKSKKSRRKNSNDDDCDKEGHKEDKGRSSKNRESDIKPAMSAYQLAAKVMKLRMEGKREEALKLLPW